MANKFLNDTGLSHFWDKIKSFLSNDAVVHKTQSIFIGNLDSTSTAKVLTATVNGVEELKDGLCILLTNGVITSASGVTLNVNNLGAKPLYSTLFAKGDSSGRITTRFNKNYTYLFVYSEDWVSGGAWLEYDGYNSDTDIEAYYVSQKYGSYTPLTAMYRYQILFTYSDTQLLPATEVNNVVGTSKTLTDTDFDPFGPIFYWNSSSWYNAGRTIDATYLWVKRAVDLRYSFNEGTTLVEHKSVYLKCEPLTNGRAKFASGGHPIVQDLPTTEDGFIYIYLGRAYDSFHIMLDCWHPIYYFKDSAIRQWTNDIVYTAESIGAVKKSGDTLTGALVAKGNQYFEDNSVFGIHMNNSDIVGINSLYFSDQSDSGKESINFYRDSTHYDSVYSYGGTLLYVPKREKNNTIGEQGGNHLVCTLPEYEKGTGSQIMQGRVNYTRANRLAFLPADQIIIEKTTDGGTTWQSVGASDQSKRQIFSGVVGGNIVIPRTSDGKRSENCGIRITFTAMKYNVPDGTEETDKYNYWNSNYVKVQERYCSLSMFWFWLGSNGDTIRIKAERATGKKSTDWKTIFDKDWGATGWAGSDWIRFPDSTFGGDKSQTSQYWNYRISFFSRKVDGKTEFNYDTTQSIYRIYGYGENVWTMPYNLGATDHVYSIDIDQNTTFPAGVTATGGFTGNLTGTASKATNDSDGHPINTTYLKKANYIAATEAPGKVASASSAGTSTNYARQDHTHGIDLATGDANGQVKIAGTNVSVKGLAALAYKDSLSKSDVGLGNVANTADADKSVAYAASAGDANTVNGLTVLTAVPANAKFTDANTIPSAYCTTAAATAAKTASFTDYSLSPNSYFMIVVKTANTAKSKLTLNVNSKGAKDIWINGSVSSSSNYSFSAGSHLVYYDGSVYHIRTDGKIPGYEHVENKSSATIRGELTQANVVNALGYTPSSGASYEEMTVTEALMGDSTVARAISAATLRTVLQSALHVQSYTVTTVANNFVSPYKAFARIDISTALGDYPTIISTYVESPSANNPAMVAVSDTEYATLYLYSMTAAEFDVVVVLAAIYV